MTRTLLLIFAALTLMIGSFIWFVATWDRDAEAPISFILPQILVPQGEPDCNPAFSVDCQYLTDLAAKSDIPEPYQTHTGPIPNPYGVS